MNGEYHSSISFNEQTGVITFFTNDEVTFPPATYTFTITMEIGGNVESRNCEIVLQNHC